MEMMGFNKCENGEIRVHQIEEMIRLNEVKVNSKSSSKECGIWN